VNMGVAGDIFSERILKYGHVVDPPFICFGVFGLERSNLSGSRKEQMTFEKYFERDSDAEVEFSPDAKCDFLVVQYVFISPFPSLNTSTPKKEKTKKPHFKPK